MLTTKASPGSTEQTVPAAIRVYNTLTNRKEVFETVAPGKVGMYLCGPTVYKPSHIGHMVGPIIFDVIKRYLVYCGYEVTFVVNVTDVDDKLINEANQRGVSMSDVATEMTADYLRNLAAMGVDTIDHFPKATECMQQILDFIQSLIEKDFAYEADGDVYFEVSKDTDYGKLSNRTVDSMQGEGGGMATRKRSPMDFALWKSAKPDEPSWKSPWGPGRPGWHIECSAMSHAILGETFDIHGGGLDLVFPHHENEIAQSESCHGKPQAKYWLHNGLMQAADQVGKVGGRATRTAEAGDQQAQEEGKMGKSKGASAFSDLLSRHPAEAIRFLLLGTHYRSPILFSEDEIANSAGRLETFYRFFKRFERVTGQSFYTLAAPQRRAASTLGDAPLLTEMATQRTRIWEKMDDDFNTAGAIGNLFEIVTALNRYIEQEKLETPGAATEQASKIETLVMAAGVLKEMASVMALFREPQADTDGGVDDSLAGSLMELVIELRADARKRKDFATADKIRDSLTAMHIKLEDRADGTEWTLEK